MALASTPPQRRKCPGRGAAVEARIAARLHLAPRSARWSGRCRSESRRGRTTTTSTSPHTSGGPRSPQRKRAARALRRVPLAPARPRRGRSGRSSSCRELEGTAQRSPARCTTRWSTGSRRSSWGCCSSIGSPEVEPTEASAWEPEPGGRRACVSPSTPSPTPRSTSSARRGRRGHAGRWPRVAPRASPRPCAGRRCRSPRTRSTPPHPPTSTAGSARARTLVTRRSPAAAPARAQAAPRREAERRRPRAWRPAPCAASRRPCDESPHGLCARWSRSASAARGATGRQPDHVRLHRAAVQRALGDAAASSLIHSQTQELKRLRPRSTARRRSCARPRCCPGFLKDRAARLAASPRLYNLTVSNVPGPGAPLFAAGAMVEDISPGDPARRRPPALGRRAQLPRAPPLAVHADPARSPRGRRAGGLFASALGELERAPRHGAPRRRRCSARAASAPGSCRPSRRGRGARDPRRPRDRGRSARGSGPAGERRCGGGRRRRGRWRSCCSRWRGRTRAFRAGRCGSRESCSTSGSTVSSVEASDLLRARGEGAEQQPVDALADPALELLGEAFVAGDDLERQLGLADRAAELA